MREWLFSSVSVLMVSTAILYHYVLSSPQKVPAHRNGSFLETSWYLLSCSPLGGYLMYMLPRFGFFFFLLNHVTPLFRSCQRHTAIEEAEHTNSVPQVCSMQDSPYNPVGASLLGKGAQFIEWWSHSERRQTAESRRLVAATKKDITMKQWERACREISRWERREADREESKHRRPSDLPCEPSGCCVFWGQVDSVLPYLITDPFSNSLHPTYTPSVFLFWSCLRVDMSQLHMNNKLVFK